MLTKDDLEQIEKIVKTGFQDFFENIFEPYANQNEKEHGEIVTKINEIDKTQVSMKGQLEEIKEYVIDNEKRISKLEAITSVN